jgi:hypothetical protein
MQAWRSLLAYENPALDVWISARWNAHGSALASHSPSARFATVNVTLLRLLGQLFCAFWGKVDQLASVPTHRQYANFAWLQFHALVTEQESGALSSGRGVRHSRNRKDLAIAGMSEVDMLARHQ